MKISKGKLQQTAINHSSDIDFKDFMKTYKNVLQKSILFQLMIPSDNPLIFGNEYIVIMTIDDQIKDEKIGYDINPHMHEIFLKLCCMKQVLGDPQNDMLN